MVTNLKRENENGKSAMMKSMEVTRRRMDAHKSDLAKGMPTRAERRRIAKAEARQAADERMARAGGNSRFIAMR